MEFLLSYWWLILIGLIVVGVVSYGIYVFVNMPADDQLSKLEEWLLYAVTVAEKELGSGTGQIKLRYVYDMFLSKFPFLSKTVSFDAFSFLVDEALDKFRDLLEKNNKVKNYVESKEDK